MIACASTSCAGLPSLGKRMFAMLCFGDLLTVMTLLLEVHCNSTKWGDQKAVEVLQLARIRVPQTPPHQETSAWGGDLRTHA